MDLIERRAAWLAVCVAIVLAFEASGGLGLAFSGIGRWELVAYVADLVFLAGSAVVLAGSIVPDSIRSVSPEDRERLIFYALVLFVLAVIVIAGLSIHTGIRGYQHPSG